MEKTLYSFVFEQIEADIYRGNYEYGQKLPTLEQLCERFGVGRNTVRLAIQYLEAKGYVSCEKGRNAIVCYDLVNPIAIQSYKAAIFSRKQAIHDVFETLTLIAPDIVAETLKKATNEEMEQLKEKIKNIVKDGTIHTESQLMSSLMEVYMYVFSLTSNPLLTHLFRKLLDFTYLPLTDGFRKTSDLKKNIVYIKGMISKLLRFALLGNMYMLKGMIRLFCDMYAKTSQEYILLFCEGVSEPKQVPFYWQSDYSHEFLYYQVMINVLQDIKAQTFVEGDLLPAGKLLAKKYQVSVRTYSKAMEILNELKIIKTVNGVGSKVVMSHVHSDANIIKSPSFTTMLCDYLYAIEMVDYTFKQLLKKVLMKLDDRQIKSIVQQMERQKDFDFALLFDVVVAQCNPCLQTIYQELKKSLVWEDYLHKILEIDNQKLNKDRYRRLLIHALTKQHYQKITKTMSAYFMELYQIFQPYR